MRHQNALFVPLGGGPAVQDGARCIVSCSVSSGKRATTDNNRCAAAHACASTHQRLSRRVDRCLRFFASRMKIVVEPTGYLGFAAAHCVAGRFTSKCIGVLLSGGNMGLDRYAALLAQ